MTFSGTLYPFQSEAVDRMIEQRRLLVALYMGLGKTVISIAAVERLIDAEEVAGGLVIVPNSLKLQWQRMIADFTAGEANVMVVKGTPTQRRDQYAAYWRGEAEYLIINYDQLVNDWETIKKLPRDFIIADEVTAIKNFAPKRSKRLKRLHATFQWGLTGQPVENRAEEVFSLMQWINPEVLGPWDRFDMAFIRRNHWGKPTAYRNLPLLHKTLNDHMVRRTREDVKDQLPAIMEESILVDLDADSARLYRLIAHELLADLAEAIGGGFGNLNLLSFYSGGSDAGMVHGKIMSKMLCMRMLCDSPELLQKSAYAFRHRDGKQQGSAYAAELHERGLLTRLRSTPKLDATVELIADILEADPANKVCLFSFFKGSLRLIAAATEKLTTSVQFHGDLNIDQRDAAKQQFSNDPDTRLFLSSDAGGMGLDLPMANYLISYDLPWSAGAYAQRMARIIRLSTLWPQVTMVSMLMAGSIEERQYDLLVQKQKVADAVIDGRGINSKGRLELDLVSLTRFLEEMSV